MELKATLGQWKDFTESIIWQDIQSELQMWLKDTWELLEREDVDWETTMLLRGRARAIREMLQLPTNIISYLEEKNGTERKSSR